MSEFGYALLALAVWLLPMLIVVFALTRGERRRREARRQPRATMPR